MKNTTAKIVSLNISKKKGTIKKPVSEVIINTRGILDDAHAGNWHRQVTLLSIERIQEFSKEIGREVLPGEFAENITTEGFDLTEVSILDRFTIGNAELEVTQIGKKCHGDGCAIFREIGKCVMPHEGIFCRVLKGGFVKNEDPIEYHSKQLKISIITVSDRASKGEYEDISGPEIQKNLIEFFKEKPWKIEYVPSIVPDDTDLLKNEILKQCDHKADIIFTTGGTGISSRDITPEVVTSLIDKKLPGIMDYIRIKYGAKTPNALISRSIAGTIGKTLIYSLPGSVKAVNEYTEEILKTIEHSIFMIKDINTH